MCRKCGTTISSIMFRLLLSLLPVRSPTLDGVVERGRAQQRASRAAKFINVLLRQTMLRCATHLKSMRNVSIMD